MLLQAQKRINKLAEPALRRTFNVASEQDMLNLGTAFAHAVLPRRVSMELEAPAAKEILRIGLSSNNQPRLGKTTFVMGMLHTVQDKTVLDHAHRFQFVYYSPSIGNIRAYDCNVPRERALRSYLHDDKTKCASPLIDIVEHPHHDRFNKKFDYLVFFDVAASWHERFFKKIDFSNAPRQVTFAWAPERIHTEQFQRFMNQ